MSSTRPEGRSGTVAAAAAVALLLLVLLAGPLLAGERFYFRDLSQNHGPILDGAARLLRSGHAPWWNPWAGGGEPLFANPNQILAEPAALLALLVPHGQGLALSILAGSLLAVLFLVLLLRDCGRSPWAAAAGGLAYGLSGYALSLGTLPNILAASSWIPPALYFMGRAGRSRAWLPAAVLACAFVFAPCEPASALALLVFAPIVTALRVAPVERGDGSAKMPPLSAALVAAAVPLALGLCAAAAQILPAVYWIAASARGAGLPASEVTKWSLSLRRLPELVAPGFLGDPSRLDAWWSAGLFETGYPFILSLYVGIPVLLLAAAGMLRPARGAASVERTAGSRSLALGRGAGPERSGSNRAAPAEARWAGSVDEGLLLAVVSLIFVALAQGGLVRVLSPVVPGADLFRYPEKFLLGAFLAIPFLVSRGADRLLGSAGGFERGVAPAPASGNGKAQGAPAIPVPDPPADAAPASGNGKARGAIVISVPDPLADAAPGVLWRAVFIASGAGVAGLLLAGLLADLLFTRSWFGLARSSTLPWEGPIEGVRHSLWLGAAGTAAFLAACLVVRKVRPASRGPMLAAGVAASLVAGSLILPQGRAPLWRIRANPSAPAALFRGAPLFAQRLRSLEAPGERLVHLERPAGFAGRTRTGTIADLFAWERRSLERSSASEFGIELAFDRSTDRVDPRATAEAQAFFAGRPASEQSRFWSLASVRYVLSYERLDAPDLELVERLEGESNIPVLLYENHGALPRARIAESSREVRTDQDAFRSIASADGDEWRTTCLLLSGGAGGPDGGESRIGAGAERGAARSAAPPGDAALPGEGSPPASSPRRAEGSGGGSRPIETLERRPGAARIKVLERTAPGPEGKRAGAGPDWLVFAENDVPGWTAKVDGRGAPLVRANGMHLAVPVPRQGTHIVDLNYVPPGLAAGAVVSLLALSVSVLLVFTGRRGPR